MHEAWYTVLVLFSVQNIEELWQNRHKMQILSLSYYGLGPERYAPNLISLWMTLEVGVANPCCSAPSNCSCEPTLSRGRENALEMTR
jgi:hypothetical protein